MAKPASNLTWTEIDPSTLDDASRTAYENYKRLYREMKAAREAFEATTNAAAGYTATSPSRLVFGYNFGKLSIAVAPNEQRAKPASRSAQSLADYLKAQHASGR